MFISRNPFLYINNNNINNINNINNNNNNNNDNNDTYCLLGKWFVILEFYKTILCY